jgi:hypothetical protein
MPDVKISAGADPGTLTATDKVPMARSASTTAYAATMAELATYANGAYTPNYFAGTPSMDGTGAPGTAAFVSRGDHVHPSDTTRVPLGGGTMTGPLTLSGVPTVSLHAATKGYVDTATGGSTAAIPGASYADNGGFAVNQRNYVSGTALAAGIYGHDRWKAGAGGCTYTFTQSGNPATTLTITAGSLQQVVEGAAIIGGTYTLSWTGTAQGRVGAGSYAASPVTASGITASANTTVEFNAGTLGRVKFEAGSTATPWVADSPQQALARCQRFYQTVLVNSRVNATAAQQMSAPVFWPAMRGNPSIALGTTGSRTNVSGITLTASGVSGGRLNCASSTTGDAFVLDETWTLSADL